MKINENQKMILYIAIVVMVLMFLFPPMVLTVYNRAWGYKFLFTVISDNELSINMTQLMLQWVGVAIVGGVAFLLAGDKGKT